MLYALPQVSRLGRIIIFYCQVQKVYYDVNISFSI